MDPLLVGLRLIHIVCGVYWAGTIFFFTTYLEPSLRELGPDGGKVMIKFFERGYLTVLPVVALLTILSGVWLLWMTSAGFSPLFMGSGLGIALSIGGLMAIVAFLVGIAVMRPAAMKIWAIARQMPQVKDDTARNALMADMGRLRARTGIAARIIFALLVVAVTMMAVARYV